MHVYLIRHAHALDAEQDPARPLSPRGRRQVRALAKFLRRSGVFQPTEIWHSSLARSRETAEALAQRLELTAPRSATADLEPEADVASLAERIRGVSHPLAVVGHEPQLSALATLLVAGKAAPATFVMKKCAALALEGIGPHWSVRWHVSPELLA